jgi:hypothetical protein
MRASQHYTKRTFVESIRAHKWKVKPNVLKSTSTRKSGALAGAPVRLPLSSINAHTRTQGAQRAE